jgi:AraC-like DNA-binding protein
VPQSIVVYAVRERARALARDAFPRRRCRAVFVRDATEFSRAFRSELVDAALVDLGGGADDAWRAAAMARDFPSVAFFGVLPVRAADSGTVARCVTLEFVDVIAEGVDDVAARDLVLPHGFSARFAAALREPPPSLGLTTPVQRQTWQCVVAYAGRTVRTEEIAKSQGVTREHLSRSFSAAGGPNLKRIIDLVRLIAAAELSKNPGYDVGDVARVLGFASSSHLSSTAQRVVGTRPASLARLRTVDLVERFAHGRGRSRTTP